MPATASTRHATSPRPADLVVARVFYLLYYAAAAALLPFLTLYYQQCGLVGRQIGVLAGIPPVLVLVGASLWSAVADATRRHKAVLMTAIVGTAAAAGLLGQLTAFAAMLPAVVALALFLAPIPSLADHTVLELLAAQRHRYGRIRLWGAVGWGLTAPAMGLLVQRTGLGSAFRACIGLLALLLVAALWLPVTGRPRHTPFWHGLRQLSRRPGWRLFLLLALVGGAGQGFAHHYLFIYMESLGAGGATMGLALSAATVSELVFFILADRILRRWGTQRVLFAGMAAAGLRLLLYALVREPWLVLAVQLLHGPAFAMVWAAGVSCSHRLAPAGLGATAQGIFAGVNFGLAGAAGALVGGLLLERMGPGPMYAWAGTGVLLLIGLLRLLAPGNGLAALDEAPDAAHTKER